MEHHFDNGHEFFESIDLDRMFKSMKTMEVCLQVHKVPCLATSRDIVILPPLLLGQKRCPGALNFGG